MATSEPGPRQMAAHAVNLRAAGKLAAAEAVGRFALALAPNDPHVMMNMGAVILTSQKSAEARNLTSAALAKEPAMKPRFMENLGLASLYSGDVANAIRYFTEAVELQKGGPAIDARFNLACATLLSGDWVEGLKLMEVKRERDKHPAYPMPEWDGEPIDGTLWVEAEQGFGDIWQFARFLPLARARAKRLVFSCPGQVMAIMYGYPGVDEVRLQEENVPIPEDAIAHAPLQSLATLIGATPENCPQDPGHFAKKATAWPVSIERHPRSVISAGLVWAGRPEHPRDAERSIPLEKFFPVLSIPEVQWFSLQTGARGKDPVDSGIQVLIEDLREELTSWLRTAAVINALDLVVTVDTAVAHMAAAIGKPTWLLTSRIPDWRWGLGSDRTPWYPSVRMFRQKKLLEWDPVIEAVGASLRSHIEGKKKARDKVVPLSNPNAVVRGLAGARHPGPHEPPRPPNHNPVA